MKRAVGILIIAYTLALGLPAYQTLTQAKPVSPQTGPSSPNNANTCQAILVKALDALQSNCDGIGRNQVCYGNYRVNAELVDGAQALFNNVGDTVRISDIRTLSTMRLDADRGIWGLSLMKLQANLPDTLPGQNVTFLIYGDTRVENLSGDMRSFYFTSGLGEPSCNEVPKDSIVVKSPNHTKVTFEANGTQITIGSTILMRAVKGQQMTVALVEGHAEITTPQGSQTLLPGEQTTVQLGGSTGFAPIDAPSAPIAFADANDSATVNMIDQAEQATDDTSSETETPTDEALGATQDDQQAVPDSVSTDSVSTDSPITETPTQTPLPTKVQTQTKVPPPTKAPAPTKRPPSTKVPAPTKAPYPTKASAPTKIPPSTKVPPPTKAPAPTKAPPPTKVPPPTKIP